MDVNTTRLLVQTVQELSLARSIERVMEIVRRVARELTGADGATFVLRTGICAFMRTRMPLVHSGKEVVFL